MIRVVFDEEIKGALFSIGDDKSLGPDGLSAYFFKRAWSTVSSDFCEAIREFFSTGQLLKQMNHSIIALAPKNISAFRVEDYRPIAYYNVSYMVISKILVAKLARIMTKLIDPAQSALFKAVPWLRMFICSRSSSSIMVRVGFLLDAS